MKGQDQAKNFISIENQPITHDVYVDILRCFEDINKAAYPIIPNQYIHYTSTQSFQAMLKPFAEEHKDYVILFASKVQFLNDSSEFKTGFDLVKNNYEYYAKKFGLGQELKLRDDAFTISFCGEEDLLSQWKYYGKGSGVAIEFDFSSDRLKCNFLWTKSKPVGENKWDYDVYYAFPLMPSSVIYGQVRQMKVFEEMVSLIGKKDMGMYKNVIINSFIPFCKNISFIEEKESRLLFYPISGEGPQSQESTPVRYRSTNDKIIPQFECRLSYRDFDRCKCEGSPIPIKNIMIGPGYNQTEVFNGVISMLEHGTSTIGYIGDEKIEAIKKDYKTRVDYLDMQSIGINDLCVVVKEKITQVPGENAPIADKLEYVTYKTSNGITVQMSATPFRS